jgi:hypothetical protein
MSCFSMLLSSLMPNPGHSQNDWTFIRWESLLRCISMLWSKMLLINVQWWTRVYSPWAGKEITLLYLTLLQRAVVRQVLHALHDQAHPLQYARRKYLQTGCVISIWCYWKKTAPLLTYCRVTARWSIPYVEKLRHLTFGARQGRGEDNKGVNDVNDVEEARNQGRM